MEPRPNRNTPMDEKFGFAATLFTDYLSLTELYRLFPHESTLADSNEIWTRRLQLDYGIDPITDDPLEEYKAKSFDDLFHRIRPIHVSPEMCDFVGLTSNLWTMPHLVRWWTSYLVDPETGSLALYPEAEDFLKLYQNPRLPEDTPTIDDCLMAVKQHVSRRRPRLTWEELVRLSD